MKSSKYRVGATLIDKYRMFMGGEWMSYKQFVEGLTYSEELPERARIGIAVHKIIEKIILNGFEEREFLVSDGYKFHEDIFNELFKIIPASSVPEIRTIGKYETAHGLIDVVCKADALCGLVGYDAKVSLKAMKSDNYTRGLQHKFYLRHFMLKEFVWPLIQIRKIKEDDYAYELKGITTTHDSWSESYITDCNLAVNEFMDFCAENDLLQHLIPYWEKNK